MCYTFLCTYLIISIISREKERWFILKKNVLFIDYTTLFFSFLECFFGNAAWENFLYVDDEIILGSFVN